MGLETSKQAVVRSLQELFQGKGGVFEEQLLEKFSDILYKEPPEYKSLLNHELQTGISYPKARENALLMYVNDIRKYANTLSSPNNILGIEYLKAIKKLKSNILPLTVKRNAVDHDSEEIIENYASSTHIRELLCENKNITKFITNVVVAGLVSARLTDEYQNNCRGDHWSSVKRNVIWKSK